MVLSPSEGGVITSVSSMSGTHWPGHPSDAHDWDCLAINLSVLMLGEESAAIKEGEPWEAGSTVNFQAIKSNWLCFGLIVSNTACIGSSSTVIALQRGWKSEGSAVTAQDMVCRHVSQMQKWIAREKKLWRHDEAQNIIHIWQGLSAFSNLDKPAFGKISKC